MAPQQVTDQARATLEHDRAELQRRVEELDSEGEAALSYDENFADSGQVAAEQGENQALAATLREQLDDVEHALERIDQGTYGQCEVCGQPIADGRLEAMPATRFCIDHA